MCLAYLVANSLVSPGFGSCGISFPSIAMGSCTPKWTLELLLLSVLTILSTWPWVRLEHTTVVPTSQCIDTRWM